MSEPYNPKEKERAKKVVLTTNKKLKFVVDGVEVAVVDNVEYSLDRPIRPIKVIESDWSKDE